ncbi:hypothetical protein MTBSS4_260065 [Magnetospirillum sp. SS-4]|nr:hypothetical protein MTBSS4_260065 [Magnetospirillum sp. SS-4]
MIIIGKVVALGRDFTLPMPDEAEAIQGH